MGKPRSEWQTLFFSIVRNNISDVRRKFKSRASVMLASEVGASEGAGDAVERSASPSLSPEKHTANSQLAKSISNAIDRLPERQREVFLLRERMQYSIKETCNLLGLTSGTVKQHHFRALKQLRTLLAEVWSDE